MNMATDRVTGCLVTIGDELLLGDIANGNSRHIAMELRSRGFLLSRMVTVGDQEDAIVEVLLDCLQRGRFLIVTGGLGPTEDDRTPGAVSKALDRPLLPNEEYMEWLRQRLKAAGRPWSDAVGKMAYLPENAAKIGVGMAGFSLVHQGIPCYFLPGVPKEMRWLMAHVVLPDLEERFPRRLRYVKEFLRIQGLYESEISRRLEGFDPSRLEVEMGYLPQWPEVWLTLLAAGVSAEAAMEKIAEAERALRPRFDRHHISGRSDDPIEAVIGRDLLARGFKLAVAESCTGGLIARRITAVAGASDYFDRGCVVYSNAAKMQLLKVPPSLLEEHGAVSEPVAAAMAEGMRAQCDVDVALAVTGIAGPTGGSPEKPVGTVFIACSDRQATRVEKHRFRGDRGDIQEHSAHAALVLLWKTMNP
ncbi:MAG: CinA family nicotinamide mononucleotide deamidase-related protein [Deltaproteobacteria bacterium]|nr:CinA family nicotinamide mononucleotide deamidase-related protein [Deltaproteobacteria bacterium]